MSTTTTNLNMVLNEGQDKFSIPTLNENLTKIDTAIGEQNKNLNVKLFATNITNFDIIYNDYLVQLNINGAITTDLIAYTIPNEYRPHKTLDVYGYIYEGTSEAYDALVRVNTDGKINIFYRQTHNSPWSSFSHQSWNVNVNIVYLK